mgnify:CR=1 FL=1
MKHLFLLFPTLLLMVNCNDTAKKNSKVEIINSTIDTVKTVKIPELNITKNFVLGKFNYKTDATFVKVNAKHSAKQLYLKKEAYTFVLSENTPWEQLAKQFGEDPSQLASLAHDAVIIGAVAGIMCQEMVNLIRNKFKIDDTLDVFAVHGVGGIFGTIMIAVFGAGSWLAQLGSLVIVGAYTLAVTIAIAVIVKRIVPLRVDLETETNGLDLSVHGERAYDFTS